MKFGINLWPALALFTSCGGGSAPPPGTPDEFERLRQAMVQEQLKSPHRNITNERVLEAMRQVQRHQFVPKSQRPSAYEDSPLPIGHGQTISQPYIVAFMTEKLDPKPTDKVLEVGTGSGYQAAVLAKLVDEVYSIEIVEPLAQQAQETLAQLEYNNVHVKAGDGYRGWAEHAPFDSVIVTCAPDHVPEPLVEQLKEAGKMIIPVGRALGRQELYLLRKKGGKMKQEGVLPVRFVPMTGESEKN